MHVGLVAGEEPGAHQDARGAERQRCCKPTAVHDSSGRNHGDWLHGLDDGRDEREERRRAAHMAAGLDALGDDHVNVGIGCRDCLVNGADLRDDLRPPAVRIGDPRRRIAPEQEEDRHRLVQGGLDLLPVVSVDDHVRRKRPIRQLARPPHQRPRAIGTDTRDADLAAGPGIRDGGRELGDRRASHGRGQDGVLDTEHGTERRGQHRSCLRGHLPPAACRDQAVGRIGVILVVSAAGWQLCR